MPGAPSSCSKSCAWRSYVCNSTFLSAAGLMSLVVIVCRAGNCKLSKGRLPSALGRQPAGIQQRRGIGAVLVARPANVLGGLAAGAALAAADDNAHVAAVAFRRFLERAANGGRDAARMPVEPKHAAKGLKPEGIA